jgi:hypothetical protein
MFSIKKLRTLLILNFLTIIVSAILDLYYDPYISPLIDQVDQISVESMSNFKALIFLIISLLGIITLIYSSIVLWVKHRTGKWLFLLSIVLIELSTYYIKISASTGLTLCIGDLSMLLSGMILAIIFFNTKN